MTEDHTLKAEFQGMFEAATIRCSSSSDTIRQCYTQQHAQSVLSPRLGCHSNMWAVYAGYFEVLCTIRCSTLARTWGLSHNATALIDVYAAGFFEVMFTQQVANPDQDLGFAAY